MKVINQKKGISIHTSSGEHFRIKETETGISITLVTGDLSVRKKYLSGIDIDSDGTRKKVTN